MTFSEAVSFGGRPVIGLGIMVPGAKMQAQPPQGRWVLVARPGVPPFVAVTLNRAAGHQATIGGVLWRASGGRYYRWVPNTLVTSVQRVTSPYFADSFGLGAGTTDSTLDAAAQAVVGMDSPCTMDGTVANFQTAWNNTSDSSLGSPTLGVDDKYGPDTSSALARVVGGNASGPCPQFMPAPSLPPLPAPTPVVVPPTIITPSSAPTGGSSTGPLIAGAILVAGGVAAATYVMKRRRHA